MIVNSAQAKLLENLVTSIRNNDHQSKVQSRTEQLNKLFEEAKTRKEDWNNIK